MPRVDISDNFATAPRNALPMDPVRLSKFLSLVLRHEPGAIGITLDEQGWTDVDALITRAAAAGTTFTRAELLQVVATSDKRRFTLTDDGLRIRAAQGHSVNVNLGVPPSTPPSTLFHGTATRFLTAIRAAGLRPQARQQVHLSADADTALRVGTRHGTPVILEVDAARMHALGMKFFQADNGVWLTDHVPPDFLQVRQ